jgi:hypothetical protein
MIRQREKRMMPTREPRTWNRLRRSPSKKMPVFLRPRRQKLLIVQSTVDPELKSTDGSIAFVSKVWFETHIPFLGLVSSFKFKNCALISSVIAVIILMSISLNAKLQFSLNYVCVIL